MKKALPYLSLCFLLFFSCKKQHTPAPEKKYKITYDLSGFSQQVIGSATKKTINNVHLNSTTWLAASANFLNYRVYDFNTGALIHQINQDSSMANFGNISDYLPAGKYVVAFVASKNALPVNSLPLNSGAGITLSGLTSWPDVFYYKDTITVNAGDINASINLNRIVGQLTIKLLDVFPAEANKLTITVSGEYKTFSIATSSVTGDVTTLTYDDLIPSEFKTNAGYKRSNFMMNNAAPFTVTLTCYDAANKILAQTQIPDVSIQWNTQTILTGNLFASGAGFNVGLNLPFDPNEITVQF